MQLNAVFVLILLFVSSSLLAQREVNGDITINARWSGKIIVNGDITIQKNATLTITPGSRIVISANSDENRGGKDPDRVEITVLGRIIAEGSPGQGSIVFTSSSNEPRLNDWYGIIIKNLRVPSRFSNCVVEYTYKGLTCFGSSPEISECEIRFSQYAGISCEVRAAPFIRTTSILGNDFAGIICELGSNPLIEKSVITQNSNGVVIFDKSNPDFGHVSPGAGQSAGENLIANNFESAIHNRSTNDIYAQNNIWTSTRSDEISEEIYDSEDNPGCGKVVFEPLLDRSSRPSPAAAILASRQTPVQQQVNQRTAANNVPPPDANTSSANSGAATNTAALGAARNSAIQPLPAQNQPQQQVPVQTDNLPVTNPDAEALLASNTNSTASLPVPADSSAQSPSVDQMDIQPITRQQMPTLEPSQVLTDEPLIERLLDSGKREYVSRVVPEYPDIYRRTSHEGRVVLEVTVDKSGMVADYRVLRTDGEHFTNSAVRAIQKYRYKPGTFQGEAVVFKVIEPFIFKLRN